MTQDGFKIPEEEGGGQRAALSHSSLHLVGGQPETVDKGGGAVCGVVIQELDCLDE